MKTRVTEGRNGGNRYERAVSASSPHRRARRGRRSGPSRPQWSPTGRRRATPPRGRPRHVGRPRPGRVRAGVRARASVTQPITAAPIATTIQYCGFAAPSSERACPTPTIDSVATEANARSPPRKAALPTVFSSRASSISLSRHHSIALSTPATVSTISSICASDHDQRRRQRDGVAGGADQHAGLEAPSGRPRSARLVGLPAIGASSMPATRPRLRMSMTCGLALSECTASAQTVLAARARAANRPSS